MKSKFIALWLCFACVLMFLLQGVIGTDALVLDRSLMWEQPWRILTSIFAHSGVGHLLSNLFALGLFGLILEGRIGSKRLFWLFMLTGILVNFATPYPRSLGASGAIYGILGALAMLRPWMMVWLNGMPMPMILAGVLWFAQDAIGVFTPSNIGHLAHIGGLFIGIGIGIYWRKYFADRPKHPKGGKDLRLERELDAWESRYMN